MDKLSSKQIITLIQSHPNFGTVVRGLLLMEFEGAIGIENSNASSYIKREQREFLIDLWNKLNFNAKIEVQVKILSPLV